MGYNERRVEVTIQPVRKSIKRLVFISTYPPRRCGIATFSQDLLQNIRQLLPGIRLEVSALNISELDTHSYPPEVVRMINQDSPDSYLEAAAAINQKADQTIVVVQHEYGIYGKQWGKNLIPLLKALKCPVITTLHTVLEKPPAAMDTVTKDIVALSDELVVLTRNSYDLLLDHYPTSKSKLSLIEHGIHPTAFRKTSKIKPQLKLANHRVLMTFGLLSRNKGIEYVINALPAIVKRFPDVIYLVVGGTHPDVLRTEGEAYRLELRELVKKLSMQNHVRIIGDYLPVNKILLYLQATDVYIAPSLDPQQAVSGTLSYALGVGAAVISTEFSQAKEILSNDIGRIVPIGDSGAISREAIKLLDDPQALEAMRRAAYASTRSMLWSNVADTYIAKIARLATKSGRHLEFLPPIKLNHVSEMSSGNGFVQFADGTRPNLRSGYTLDDNARVLQAVNGLARLHPETTKECQRLSIAYLKVIDTCLSYKPPVNYLSAASGKPTKQNLVEDFSDSFGRARYGLQTAAAGPLSTAQKAKSLIAKLPDLPSSATPRTITFYLLGACAALESGHTAAAKAVGLLADKLASLYQQTATPEWQWFEPTMTYANGQLCAGLLEAARLGGSPIYKKIGLEALDFLCGVCFMGKVYVPIGQKGWYQKDGTRALFDQQPEDVFAIIQALQSAYLLTNQKKYLGLARKAFSWFLGNNLMGLRLYDDKSGGCRDGLTSIGVNKNEGAESTVAYLQSRLIIERFAAQA